MEIDWKQKYEQLEEHYKILEWSYNECLEELQKFKDNYSREDMIDMFVAGFHNKDESKLLDEVAEDVLKSFIKSTK